MSRFLSLSFSDYFLFEYLLTKFCVGRLVCEKALPWVLEYNILPIGSNGTCELPQQLFVRLDVCILVVLPKPFQGHALIPDSCCLVNQKCVLCDLARSL